MLEIFIFTVIFLAFLNYLPDIIGFIIKLILIPFTPIIWAIGNWNKKRGYAVVMLILYTLICLLFGLIYFMETQVKG